MAKNSTLSDETVITLNKGVPVYKYRDYFRHNLKLEMDGRVNLGLWFQTQEGKTLKEAAAEYNNISGSITIGEALSDDRFSSISRRDKDFIIAFDEKIRQLGYDFGNKRLEVYDHAGTIYKSQITYGKTGTKTRSCPARIYIEKNGEIRLRLFLSKIDNHRQYIENAPAQIKDLFTSEDGKCTGCNFKDGKCKYNITKTYTIDGKLIHRCSFMFASPAMENLPDYISLLAEFFPNKKVKKT